MCRHSGWSTPVRLRDAGGRGSHLATVNWKLEQTEEVVEYDRLYLERGSHDGLKSTSRRRLAEAGVGP